MEAWRAESRLGSHFNHDKRPLIFNISTYAVLEYNISRNTTRSGREPLGDSELVPSSQAMVPDADWTRRLGLNGLVTSNLNGVVDHATA